MNEQLKTLMSLQMNEMETDQTHALIGRLLEKKAQIESELTAFEDELNREMSSLVELRKEYRSMESDVQMNHERAKKSEATLRSVKTNREYQALLKEIDDQKAKIWTLEEAMLERLEKIEETEASIRIKKEEYLKFQQKVEKEKEIVEQEEKKGEKKIVGLKIKHDEISKIVDSGLYKKYQFIKSRIGTTVVVPVKNYTCFGCNMNIPPQMYNELQQNDDLAFCPHCQRMIYWETG